MTQKIKSKINMDQSIDELIAKLQTGELTHPQFLAQMKKLDSPQQVIQKKEQKIERAMVRRVRLVFPP